VLAVLPFAVQFSGRAYNQICGTAAQGLTRAPSTAGLTRSDLHLRASGHSASSKGCLSLHITAHTATAQGKPAWKHLNPQVGTAGRRPRALRLRSVVLDLPG